LIERDEELLYRLVASLEKEDFHKESNNFLMLAGIMIYSLISSDTSLLRDTIVKTEELIFGNISYIRAFSNLIGFFTFYIKVAVEQDKRVDFNDQLIGPTIRFISQSLMVYFQKVFEGNEEYDGDKEERKFHEIFYSTIDLVLTNLGKTSKTRQSYISASDIMEMLISITSFMVVEKEVANMGRWMRLINTFFKVIETPLLQCWLYASKFDKSRFAKNIRLRRFFTSELQEEELTLQLIIKLFFDKFRTLDFAAGGYSVFLPTLSKMISVYKDKSGYISCEYGCEKSFIYFNDIIVTICLNERVGDLIEALQNTLSNSCKQYSGSFAKLLSEAEQKKQPKRLAFLRTIWERHTC